MTVWTTDNSKHIETAILSDDENGDKVPLLRSGTQENSTSDYQEDDWVDITASFRILSTALSPGELIHDSRFTLVDSMTAVEFMDPRMDLYVRSKWTKHGPIDIKESLDNLVELETFRDEDVIGITDELVSLVATWLDGHTLAQTVFTCIYLHEISKVQHTLLRNVLISVLTCVELIRKNLFRAMVCVEDDHQCLTLGLDIDRQLKGSDAAILQLKEKEDSLQHRLKKASHSNKHPNEDEVTSVEPNLQHQKALLARIRMLRLLVQLLRGLGEDKGKETYPAHKEWMVHCIEGCREMRETLSLGTLWADNEQRLHFGFHDAINNLILPPSPRQVTRLTRKEGADYMLQCLLGLQEALKIRELSGLKEIQTSVMALCTSAESSNVMVRSFLKNILHDLFLSKKDGHCFLEVLIRQDIRHFSSPSSLNPKTPLGSLPKARELVDKLLPMLVDPVCDSILLYCDHRSRHQERITCCLNLLGDLQQEVEATDHLLHQLILKTDPQREHVKLYSLWVLRLILVLMIDFINVGIEFNLYTLGETHYALWYLDYLYGCLCRILKGAKQSTEKELNLVSKSGKQKAKMKKNTHHKDLEKEILFATVKKVMCSALMRAIEAAAADQKLPAIAARFSKEELRYRHRFSAFVVVSTPRLRMHSEYIHELSISAYSGRHTNLFVLASKGFMAAKNSLDGMTLNEDSKGLLKTIKTNMVVCNLAVAGRHKEDSSLLSLDYSSHKHFPILRLL